jgi:hypothetical protein
VTKFSGKPLTTLSFALNRLIEVLDLTHFLHEDTQGISVHRFRKTLARIVALTLTNAQTILMDCFGHEDPNVTLCSYIMSDKLIVADVQRIQRELVILLAKDAINESESLGGLGGERVRDAKNKYLRLHQKSSLDPGDITEIAEMLTLDGRDWVVVMPGVICTLPRFSKGPCANRQGARNPGNCQTGCAHQILTAYNMSETDDMVSYVLTELKNALDQQSVTLSMWISHLRYWLYRWRSVYDKWANHPLVLAYGDPDFRREDIPA